MKYAIPPEVLNRHGKVFLHAVGDEKVFVKKNHRGKNPVGKFFQTILYRLTGNPLVQPPAQPEDGAVRHETEKLAALMVAGLPTPKVLHVDRDYFVMSSVGETLEHMLRLDPEKRSYYIARAAEALGRFHAAGFAHGGAQAKNITVLDGDIYFIDFEERIPRDKTADFQLRDLFLFILSLERNGLDPDIGEIVAAYCPQKQRETLAELSRQIRAMKLVRFFDLPVFRAMKLRDIRAIGRLTRKVDQK